MQTLEEKETDDGSGHSNTDVVFQDVLFQDVLFQSGVVEQSTSTQEQHAVKGSRPPFV
jgi:hypothetical protein